MNFNYILIPTLLLIVTVNALAKENPTNEMHLVDTVNISNTIHDDDDENSKKKRDTMTVLKNSSTTERDLSDDLFMDLELTENGELIENGMQLMLDQNEELEVEKLRKLENFKEQSRLLAEEEKEYLNESAPSDYDN